MKKENIEVINNETTEVTGGLLKSGKGKIAVGVGAVAALAGIGVAIYKKITRNKVESTVETEVNE